MGCQHSLPVAISLERENQFFCVESGQLSKIPFFNCSVCIFSFRLNGLGYYQSFFHELTSHCHADIFSWINHTCVKKTRLVKTTYIDRVRLKNLYNILSKLLPAVVAWFVRVSVFHSVNSAPSANSASNPAWECCIDRLNLKLFFLFCISN